MASERRPEAADAARAASLADTIVAIATPPGVAALAVLRLSGPSAFDLVDRLTDVPREPPRTAHLRTLRDPGRGDDPAGEVLDQVVLTLFPAPDSYTGEDVVEISTHGGRVAPHLVRDALERLGARRARPGEFTQRAWLNGKVDLVQAEAVADLVEGSSRALHRVALRQLDRGLSSRIAELRSRIVALEARMVHHIDFPEEDDAPVGVEVLAEDARRLSEDFGRLAATAPVGRMLRSGMRTVIAGRPNAGKSSLLNALVGEERAIVTEVPGTTRDRIEVAVEIEGLPFVLVDTAGLRTTEDRVEREGIAIAEAALVEADLVLHCVPMGVGEEVGEEVGKAAGIEGGSAGAPGVSERMVADASRLRRAAGDARDLQVLTVRTKADLVDGDLDPVGNDGGTNSFPVSALDGRGLAALRDAMVEAACSGEITIDDERPILTRERQVEGVRRAAREMLHFADALEGGIPPEVAAAHLKSAATATEELLGTIGTDDVLDRVFSDFCIGK